MERIFSNCFGNSCPSTEFRTGSVHSLIRPFFEQAGPLGTPMVIIDPHAPAIAEVHGLAKDHRAHVVFSAAHNKAPGGISPAEMINDGLRRARLEGHKFFGIISGDLASHIPRVVPEMLRRLEADPELTTVGVAIDTVHDLDLLRRMKTYGMQELTPDNYAVALPNNAFSIHRVTAGINGHLPEDFHFAELFEDQLGYIQIGGRREPLRYNEEIARILRQIRTRPLKMLLLASEEYTLRRDDIRSVSSSPYKKERRQPTADSYRRHPDYAVSDEVLSDYLQNYYQVDFGLAA